MSNKEYLVITVSRASRSPSPNLDRVARMEGNTEVVVEQIVVQRRALVETNHSRDQQVSVLAQKTAEADQVTVQ
ncbi:hypothetical protein PsorP6_011911 [Peronosclerospora sorghi]|uniref:Uncharacterized protein n=1 Tax=Peronosclerospora sorghi TaxID=230839 RepID=A0ACC0WKU0_9STRA|nr:hypothetical protein PsorP6_011911 [Peronosclerospora sorghi]